MIRHYIHKFALLKNSDQKYLQSLKIHNNNSFPQSGTTTRGEQRAAERERQRENFSKLEAENERLRKAAEEERLRKASKSTCEQLTEHKIINLLTEGTYKHEPNSKIIINTKCTKNNEVQWKRLRAMNHPDKNPGCTNIANENFKLIDNVWKTILNCK